MTGRKRCQVALNYIPAIIRIVVVCTIRGEMLKKTKKQKKKTGRTSAIFRMLCCCVPVLFSVFVVSVIVKWLKQKRKHRKGQKKNNPGCAKQ